MNKLVVKLYGLNWRVVLALTSLIAFALVGSADDPSPG